MLVAVAVSMLGVLVNTNYRYRYTPRPSELPYRSAVQPYSNRSRISSDRLQLGYSKLGVRGLFIWHFH
jgi:hypothetical protein